MMITRKCSEENILFEKTVLIHVTWHFIHFDWFLNALWTYLYFQGTVTSGGSRISQRRRRPLRGMPTCYVTIFSQNFMKIKKFWPRGSRVPCAPPLDLPMVILMYGMIIYQKINPCETRSKLSHFCWFVQFRRGILFLLSGMSVVPGSVCKIKRPCLIW